MSEHVQDSIEILAQFKECIARLEQIEEELTLLKNSRIKQIASKRPLSKKTTIEKTATNNVYYIAPHIIADYNFLRGQNLPIPKIIAILKLWTDSVELLVALNHSLLTKSKRLAAHVEQTLNVCLSVAKNIQAVLDRHQKSDS